MGDYKVILINLVVIFKKIYLITTIILYTANLVILNAGIEATTNKLITKITKVLYTMI